MKVKVKGCGHKVKKRDFQRLYKVYFTCGIEVKGHKGQRQRSRDLRSKVKVLCQRSRSTLKKTCFYGLCTVHLICNLEVKGHKYQGQRSHGSMSNKDPKQRQVGSRQAASLA